VSAGLGAGDAVGDGGRRPWTRGDLRSRSDELAEPAVASGGAIEAVIEATGLRTPENVLRVIDPAILVRAFANEAASSAAAEPERAAAPLGTRPRASPPTGGAGAAAGTRHRVWGRAYDPEPLLRPATGRQAAADAPASPPLPATVSKRPQRRRSV
jgi:hypothetical protein